MTDGRLPRHDRNTAGAAHRARRRPRRRPHPRPQPQRHGDVDDDDGGPPRGARGGRFRRPGRAARADPTANAGARRWWRRRRCWSPSIVVAGLLAFGLGANHGPATHPSTTAPSQARHPSAAPRPPAATTRPLSSTAPASATAPRHVRAPAGPVPPGFGRVSFTAIGTDTWWLLGSAPCSSSPCTSILRTDDGGHSFVGTPRPARPRWRSCALATPRTVLPSTPSSGPPTTPAPTGTRCASAAR